MAKFIVVGSGPSAVSVSYALLKNHHRVVMVDWGNLPNPKTMQALQPVRAEFTGVLSDALREQLKFDVTSNMPTKKMYNDEFVFADSARLKIQSHGFNSAPSLSMGGLSNVWGAGILPYVTDIDDWPITYQDLEPHYKSLHEFMPLCAVADDDLASEYPLLSGQLGQPKVSDQANQLYQKLHRKKEKLLASGMKFGFARTAFHSKECQPCGMCMYGCPVDLIYSARHDLIRLAQDENFTYLNDALVTKFSDSPTKAEITYQDRDGNQHTLSADKIILAAGALSSTGIVLRSLNYKDTILLKDKPYFMFPLIDPSLRGNLMAEKYNTLQQLFFKVDDPEISPNSIHLAMYGYNDILSRYLKAKYGPLYHLSRPVLDRVLNKTHLMQGFLHSRHGAKITMNYDGETLHIHGKAHHADHAIKKVIEKFKAVGFVPTHTEALPGRSYHIGSTLPMMKNPSGLTTDIYGKLNGSHHIHIVDAAIFPSLPSQTITYTIMANAHRIGHSF